MTPDDKRSGPRRLSEEEHSLWRGVTRSVAPLRRIAGKPASAPADEPQPGPPARKRAEAAPARHGAPKPAPSLAPLDRRLRQKLARGTQAIEARLDLHGRTLAQAHSALLRFLRQAQTDGVRTALVITGKGGTGPMHGAKGRGAIRREVPLWLRLPEFRQYVLGVGEAGVGHGGEGALYVRIRRGR